MDNEFEQTYVLEQDDTGGWVDITVFRDACQNTMIMMRDTWDRISIVGGLDNDAIDAIMEMLEQVRN